MRSGRNCLARMARHAAAFALLASIGVSLGVAARRSGLPPVARDAAASITRDELRRHLEFLASDELEGRGVGHAGNDTAVRYLAETFARIGVEPAGTDGYYQAFELHTFSLGDTNSLALPEPEQQASHKEPGDEFFPFRESPSGDLAGPIAFAGYGIAAPDHRYDDYAGLDVRNRLVVVLADEPGEHDPLGRFGAQAPTSHASLARKAETARARGAIGLLVVPDAAQHAGHERIAEFSTIWPVQDSVRTRQFALAEGFQPSALPAAAVSVRIANAMLRAGALPGQPITVEAWQRQIDQALAAAAPDEQIDAPGSFLAPSSLEITMRVTVERRTVTARNVLARVPGVDPALADETVIVSAHLDHDGLDAARQVYNGADDDGSGTVAVMEIADALRQAALRGEPPRRAIVFGLWNAEEKGALGSIHYVRHPTPAGTSPVANLNLDMVGRSEDVPDPESPRFRGLPRTTALQNANTLHILGYSLSPDLLAIVKEENVDIGLDLKTEYDHNAQDLLRRSDQWSFLEQRVPALFFTTGLHPDYHTPDDDVVKIDFGKMTRIARLVYQTAWRLASEVSRPRYQDPDAPVSIR